MNAIDCPPLFSLGLLILLSSSINTGWGRIVPGSMMLLWDNFGGSVNATQRLLFFEIASVNKLSSLVMIALAERSGAGMTSDSKIISFPRGGRKDPEKPGHPYEAASVSLCFGDLAVFPSCKTCFSFGARG